MKRLVYLVFAFILTVPMSAYAATAETSTFAAQKENEYSQEYYDKIIEELSNEYGLEIRQGMPNDIDGKTTQLLNNQAKENKQLTPDEFEKFLREELEKISLHNQKVKEKYEETGDSLEKAQWFPCGENSNQARMKSCIIDKKYKGGLNDNTVKGHLEGIIDNSYGYWTFNQVDDTSASWSTWNSIYKSKTYTNKFIDSRRTSAVTYNGYVYYATGNFTVYDIKEYVEYYASEGA